MGFKGMEIIQNHHIVILRELFQLCFFQPKRSRPCPRRLLRFLFPFEESRIGRRLYKTVSGITIYRWAEQIKLFVVLTGKLSATAGIGAEGLI